jgi:toxin ParE1/3/4
MPFEVLLTEGAQRDLESIYDYIAKQDGPARADRVLDRLLVVAEQLREHPNRGTYPEELLALGIREYRQVYLRPYRLIYRAIGARVFISVIADGRRDFQNLLARRLLEGE